jgi:glucose-6-phosphate isomerase
MDHDRKTWTEPMTRGTLVAVAPGVAHKAANTGSEPLVFASFWPTETGHDYETIRVDGFSGRVRIVDGKAELVTG